MKTNDGVTKKRIRSLTPQFRSVSKRITLVLCAGPTNKDVSRESASCIQMRIRIQADNRISHTDTQHVLFVTAIYTTQKRCFVVSCSFVRCSLRVAFFFASQVSLRDTHVRHLTGTCNERSLYTDTVTAEQTTVRSKSIFFEILQTKCYLSYHICISVGIT
jgi:hypothetical protein